MRDAVGTDRSQRQRAWLAVVALIGLLGGLFAGPVLAQTPTPTPNGMATVREHTITVSGVGRVFVTPDEALVTLGVQVTRSTAVAARDDAAAAMTAVVAALRALGIAESDIQTSQLSIGPVYDYLDGRTAHITGYQVSNIVSVKVRDLAVLAPAIDDAVAAGATTVGGISFLIADTRATETEARQAAVRDARSRADTLAQAAGVTIAGVASISESYSAPWNWQGGDRGEAPTPILPGTAEVTVTVVVAYLIQ